LKKSDSGLKVESRSRFGKMPVFNGPVTSSPL
jgi:hypothetical protein